MQAQSRLHATPVLTPVAVPALPDLVAPPRYNFAGFCIMCEERGCRSTACAEFYAARTWQVCPSCGGSGRERVSGRDCGCLFGVIEAAPDDAVLGLCPNPTDRDCRCPACLWCEEHEVAYVVAGNARAVVA
jgi:hypothetical protein